MSPDEWDRHAHWWQEQFTAGADPEYEEQILPLVDLHLAGTRRVLEIGCGEGQVARRVSALGASVLGIDPSNEQLAVARTRGGGAVYARADAVAVPVPGAAFDAVVISLVLEHVDALDAAIDEVGRVLRPGGTFVLFLNHPLLQTPGSGWIDDHILEEQYWRVGPYLVEDRTLEEVAPGVEIPFVHRPLSRYVNAVVRAGLVITHLDEPPPPPGFLRRAPEYEAAATIPRLLVIVAQKL